MNEIQDQKSKEEHSGKQFRTVGIGKIVLWFYLMLLSFSWMLMFQWFIENTEEFAYLVKTYSGFGFLGLLAYFTLVGTLACVVVSRWLLSSNSIAMLVSGTEKDSLLIQVFRYVVSTVLFMGLGNVVTYMSALFFVRALIL